MIKVKEVLTADELNKFIELPFRLYKKDRHYSPQLRWDIEKDFVPQKNPVFKHSKIKLFIAYLYDKVVGRIVSVINTRHLAIHKDGVGFFGFFESQNNIEIAKSLLDRVKKELLINELKVMRGPMNFSINDECGLLYNGFGMPAMIMTPYNPPYYTSLLEHYGMVKSKDLYAYIYYLSADIPAKVHRVAAIARKKDISIRTININDFGSELMRFKSVYNSAWKDSWGFIPFSNDDMQYMGNKLKAVMIPELMLIAEKGSETIGCLGLLPDFNFVLRRMSGKLNPITIIKALYYLRKVKDLKLLLFGIKKEYRTQGIDALLIEEAFKRIRKEGYERAEFSWIAEDNKPAQHIVEMLGGKLYKTFRVYEQVFDEY
ncbi:MAG: GNAT family N-acetyltransferase [Candidatus Magnetoovum sp. WYHC-5]|nr:GNAT family N-acetyltransferase [Candidatus Magnetoovum sp. WYHC-5]